MYGSVSDLVDTSAPALQDDDFQQFGRVTLCVLTCIYGQHLHRSKVKTVEQSRLGSNAQILCNCETFTI